MIVNALRKTLLLWASVLVVLPGPPVFAIFGSGVVVVAHDNTATANFAQTMVHYARELEHWRQQIEEYQAMVTNLHTQIEIVGNLNDIYESVRSIQDSVRYARSVADADAWRPRDPWRGVMFSDRLPDPSGGIIQWHESDPARPLGMNPHRIQRSDIIETPFGSHRRSGRLVKWEMLRHEAYDRYIVAIRECEDALKKEAEIQAEILEELDSGSNTQLKLEAMNTAFAASVQRANLAKACLDFYASQLMATVRDIDAAERLESLQDAEEEALHANDRRANERARRNANDNALIQEMFVGP